MPQTPEATDELLTKLVEADSVEAAAGILAESGYELTAVSAVLADDAEGPDLDFAKGDDDDGGDEDDKSKCKSPKGFSFLRDEVKKKF